MFLDWLFNTFFFSAGVLVFAKPIICGIVHCSALKENHKYMHMCITYFMSNKVTKHIVKLKCIVYKWIFMCSIKKYSLFQTDQAQMKS